MPEEVQGGWDEYRRLVISELERLHSAQGETNVKLDAIRSDFNRAIASLKDDQIAKLWSEIAVLKFKSGLWGGVAGAIPGFIIAAIVFFTHK